jgi:geranylgeranyl pyrophosphate synthase
MINLILMTIRTLSKNINIIKRHIPLDQILDMYICIIDELVDNIGNDGIISDIKYNVKGQIKNDIYQYYFKDNNAKCDNLSKVRVISEEYLDTITDNRVSTLSELAVSIAWILGNGDKNKLTEIKKVGKYFGYIYQLAVDFKRVETDLENINNKNYTTYNYVINCGFQKAHEKFMHNKEQMIEKLIKLNIYTCTIKELISLLESWVDEVIEKTSPDLISHHSTLNTEYLNKYK